MRARPPIHSTRGLAFLFAFVSALVVASVAHGAIAPKAQTTAPVPQHTLDPKFAASFKKAFNKTAPADLAITRMACYYVPAHKDNAGQAVPTYEDCILFEKEPTKPPIVCGELAVKVKFKKADPVSSVLAASTMKCTEAKNLIDNAGLNAA